MTQTQKMIRPPFKITRGQFYLSQWIIEHFPKDYEKLDYVEPYAGAASVLLNKEKGREECYNDLDEGVVQIFRALRDEPDYFITKLKRTVYSERVFVREWNRQEELLEDYMEHAFNQFVLRRMSRGGLRQTFAYEESEENAWKTLLKELKRVADRVQGMYIFNKSAVEVIKAFDDENTLCYCHPPTVPESSLNMDPTDMLTGDHILLSEALHQHRGKVVISGHPCPLYRRLYEDWKCSRKRTERKRGAKAEAIWTNF